MKEHFDYFVSWSGGKDSTASVLLLKEKHPGAKIFVACYVPMFNATIPLIRKSHYDFIVKMKDRFERMGIRCEIVSGKSYIDYFYQVKRRGEDVGGIYGFPIPGLCGFRSCSKEKALRNIEKSISFDSHIVGIAIDEPKRFSFMNTYNGKSILMDYNMTEDDAKSYCVAHDALSPIYSETIRRDGCSLCPNKKKEDIILWLDDFPDAIGFLCALEKDALSRGKKSPYRHNVWFSDMLMGTKYEMPEM